MPYQTSGKGIRALQSSTDLLGTLPRRHIESGLKQSTMLRIHNIKQFMRGNRLAEVVDQDTKEKVPLYIGNTFDEIMDEYQLTYAKTPEGKPMMTPEGKALMLADKEGNEVRAIALADEETEGISHIAVEYELDTGKERNKEERMEVAREFLTHLGPAAAGWAIDILDLPDKQKLLTDLENSNQAEGLIAQAEELAKAANLEVSEVLQMAMEDVKEAATAQQNTNAFGAAANGGPAGQPPPTDQQQPPGGQPPQTEGQPQ